jgi:uncharacterized protein (DUF2336 family)
MRPLDSVPEGQLSYQDAKQYARHGSLAVRSALAQRTDVPPEILYFLADDPDPDVRRAIVRNLSTPGLAHLVLVDDSDDSVRSDLAARIVRLAPGLTADERDRARQTAYRVLERLVRDHLPRVRQVISDALKDVADAPPEIIHQLARDVEAAVSAPVLEYSPVLRDEDLLDIIGDKPSTAALSAISRRRRVGASVVDAIAATDDTNAIAILLANDSAQIREETLDMLIDRAAEHPSWHEPMVQRPSLRQDAAIRLAQFVADRFLQVLLTRQDLSEEALSEVRRVVHRRLLTPEIAEKDMATAAVKKGPSAAIKGKIYTALPVDELDTRSWRGGLVIAYGKAANDGENGDLSDLLIAEAVKNNDIDFIIAALAVRAGLSPTLVLNIVRAASGRGIAALVWKGGLDPALSIQVQSRLAKLPPREVITPNGDMLYGMSEAEMEWQLEMFSRLGAGA